MNVLRVFKAGEFIKEIFQNLKASQRRDLFILQVFIIFSSFVELFTVSLVPFFVGILTNPTLVDSLDFLKIFPPMDESQKVILFTTITLFLIILSNLLSPMINYLISKQSLRLTYEISTDFFTNILRRDYLFFIKNHSGSLIYKIQEELDRVISGIFTQILRLNSKLFLSFLLIVNIFMSDTKLSSLLFLLISSVYLAIYLLIKKKLKAQGEVISKENSLQYQILSEAFHGIRDVHLLHQEIKFSEDYKRSFLKLNSSLLKNDIFNMIPKYLVESTLFLGIGFSLIFLLNEKGSLIEALPSLSLFLMTGYKLIPSLSQLFSSLFSIKTNLPAYENLKNDLHFVVKNRDKDGSDFLKVSRKIVFKNLSFSYPDSNTEIFKSFNLTISTNKMTALLGSSGCGKSTLIDLMSGLLSADDGEILFDDSEIKSTDLGIWQRSFSYVSQKPFLFDGPILENITLGRDKFDENLFKRAIKLSQLDKFLVSLSDGENTLIGEEGVKLSGGQRQRVALARGLYLDRDILILDESLSEIEQVREREILSELKKSGPKTIIYITHRKSNIDLCDDIKDI